MAATRSLSVLLRLALAGGALLTLLITGDAAAKGTLLRGFSDPVFMSANGGERDRWLGESVREGAGIARIDVSWRQVTLGGSPPSDPTNPADPDYDFGEVDAAVQAAASSGLRVMITVQDAPSWAEGPDHPNWAPAGTWKPDAVAFGRFGEALGRRYSGSFVPLGSVTPLPRVEYFEPWNEPNLSGFLNPQYQGRKPVGVERYRQLLNAFFDGIHAASPGAKVIAGSTAPYGDDPPDALRTRPLEFMRELLCLKGRKRLERKKCATEAKLDLYSHHPINLSGGPRGSAEDPDDISGAADMSRVRSTLRAAERKGTVSPAGHRPLWATEIWWESRPPDMRYGNPVGVQARWIEDALYLLWREGVSTAIYLQIVDTPVGPQKYEWFQTGLFFADGRPKPAARAFRFPFVTDRRRGQKEMVAWTIPPSSGELAIERKTSGKWRTIKRANVTAGKPFSTTLRFAGTVKLRAAVGGERSLTWEQLGIHEHYGKQGARSAATARNAEAAVPRDSGLEPLLESGAGSR